MTRHGYDFLLYIPHEFLMSFRNIFIKDVKFIIIFLNLLRIVLITDKLFSAIINKSIS